MNFPDKQFQTAFDALTPTTMAVQEVLRESQKFLKLYHMQQEQLHKLVKSYQEEITKMLGPVGEAIRSAIQMTDLIEQIRKQRESEKRAFLDSGWWLSPIMMDLPVFVVNEAVHKYEQGDRAAISRMFGYVLTRDKCINLKIMISRWQSNKFFHKWRRPINQALQAHVRGDYFLSIPALLLVIEGIATDCCVSKGVYSKEIRSKGARKILTALESSGVVDEENISSNYLITTIQERIYQKTDRIVAKRGFAHFLNRHAILHGLTATYGTRKNSLQCFMLLDSLSVLD